MAKFVKMSGEVDFRVDAGFIQWKYKRASVWNNLLDVNSFGGGGLEWEYISINTLAESMKGYACDTTSAIITITLPGSGSVQIGDTVGVKNISGLNNVIIDSDGENIEGDSRDLIIDAKGAAVTLAYIDSVNGWVQVSEAFASGGGAGHEIQDGGTPMATQPALNFTGSVTVTDDTVNNATVVDVSGGDVNVQSDWNQAGTSEDDFILNKPTSMTPTAHKDTHETGGTDALSPADIGAEPAFGVQVEKTFFAGPATGANATPAFRVIASADIPTLNQNTTGTAANVTGTVAVANGGTGQTTEQLAINALTAVVGATDEHVLTKDTVTGNAVFKAAAGGGHVIEHVGTPMTARANLNFTGAGVTVTDDSGNDATVIDIPASGGGTGGGDTFLDITLTYSHHSLHGTTTTNTATEIFLNGNTNSRIIILPEQTVGFRGLVTAHNESSGNAAVWSFEGAVKNVAGTVTVVDATITKNAIAEEGIGYDVVFEADNINKALIVKVTGVSAEPVFWRARVDTTISYDGSLGFGVAWDQNSDYLWRIGSADNYTRASFDDISPWKDMRRCMMNDDGTINYYIDPDAPTFIGEVVNTGTYTTGNAAVYTGADGQVMVECPKFYYKSEKAGTVYRWWILPTPATGFSVHPAFIRPRGGTVNVATSTVTRASGDYFKTTWVENDIITIGATDYTIDSVTSTTELVIKEDAGTLTGERYLCTVGQEIDKIYFSAFEGNVASSTMRSISGVQPTAYQTIAQFRTAAKARGTGINNWNIQDFLAVSAVQLLYLIEYANFDSQTMIGQGYVNAASGSVNHSRNTGGTIALGNASGSETGTDGLVSISYRGIENFWGNIHKFVDGLNFQNYEAFVSNHDFLHDTFTGRYQSAGSVLASIGTYVKDIVFNGTDYSFLASVGGGNSGGWLHDNWSISTGDMIATFGGDWKLTTNCGAFCWYQVPSSTSIRNYASRLSFIS